MKTEVFCSICGFVVDPSLAATANLEYDVRESDAAPIERRSMKVLACNPCLQQLSKVAQDLYRRRDIGFMVSMIRTLRAAHIDQKPDPVASAIEAMESYLDDEAIEN